MKYTKPPLTLDQQADLLLKRGMAGDRDEMISRLKSVNYYRLSGYCYPFRNRDKNGEMLDDFRPGTTFEAVWMRYRFDRRLRLLVLDALERIEVAVRTQLAFHHAHTHGPFGYADDPASLPGFVGADLKKFLEHINEEVSRSRELFVEHFRTKYGADHSSLPLWMAAEVMSFGTVLSFYRGASPAIQRKVASAFGIPEIVFHSWLKSLNIIRNICAHHGRLWNRVFAITPKIPRAKDYPLWSGPAIAQNRIFAILTICKYSLGMVAPQSGWSKRLRKLLADFPEIPLPQMGFPPGWEKSNLWTDKNV